VLDSGSAAIGGGLLPDLQRGQATPAPRSRSPRDRRNLRDCGFIERQAVGAGQRGDEQIGQPGSGGPTRYPSRREDARSSTPSPSSFRRSVAPRTILFTGLSRDGTFIIEYGRGTYPLKNLRWNESPVFMLSKVELMGCPVRVSPSESSEVAPAVVVPRLKVRSFTFTSVSDAV
jgi:hypothetical protein